MFDDFAHEGEFGIRVEKTEPESVNDVALSKAMGRSGVEVVAIVAVDIGTHVGKVLAEVADEVEAMLYGSR